MATRKQASYSMRGQPNRLMAARALIGTIAVPILLSVSSTRATGIKDWRPALDPPEKIAFLASHSDAIVFATCTGQRSGRLNPNAEGVGSLATFLEIAPVRWMTGGSRFPGDPCLVSFNPNRPTPTLCRRSQPAYDHSPEVGLFFLAVSRGRAAAPGGNLCHSSTDSVLVVLDFMLIPSDSLLFYQAAVEEVLRAQTLEGLSHSSDLIVVGHPASSLKHCDPTESEPSRRIACYQIRVDRVIVGTEPLSDILVQIDRIRLNGDSGYLLFLKKTGPDWYSVTGYRAGSLEIEDGALAPGGGDLEELLQRVRRQDSRD